MRLEIYTDGSLKKNLGTWAYVIVQDNKILREDSGSVQTVEYLSSNRMEFQAAIEAIKTLEPQSEAVILSDSRNLIDTMTIWKEQWKELGWKKSLRLRKFTSPIKDLDQIQLLDTLSEHHFLQWKWIRSHSGNTFNERCDKLCIQLRNSLSPNL